MPKNKGTCASKEREQSFFSLISGHNKLNLPDLQGREERIAEEASILPSYTSGCSIASSRILQGLCKDWPEILCPAGKNEGEEKRELIFKEDGQRKTTLLLFLRSTLQKSDTEH